MKETKPRNWYHMPWQHWGPKGREGIHGLAKEAKVNKGQLASSQTFEGQTYAVAFYNEFAAYTIGQVWSQQLPDLSVTSTPKGGFPNGSVICKILFVCEDQAWRDSPGDDDEIDNLPEEIKRIAVQVPSLVNPIVWSGYVTNTYSSSNRSYRELYLIQMDLGQRHASSVRLGLRHLSV